MITAERARALLESAVGGVVPRVESDPKGITHEEAQDVRRVWASTPGTFNQALERIAKSGEQCVRCGRTFDKRKQLYVDKSTSLMLCREGCDGVLRLAPTVAELALVLAALQRDLQNEKSQSAIVTLDWVPRGRGWVVERVLNEQGRSASVRHTLHADSDTSVIAGMMVNALMTGS